MEFLSLGNLLILWSLKNKVKQTALLVKKAGLHTCMQIVGISLQPGIINKTPPNCNLKSHPWSGHISWDFPSWDFRSMFLGVPRALQDCM